MEGWYDQVRPFIQVVGKVEASDAYGCILAGDILCLVTRSRLVQLAGQW